MSDVPSDPPAGAPAEQPTPPGYAPAPQEPSSGTNRTLLLVGGVVVLVLVLAAAAFIVASGGDDDDAGDESAQEVFLEPVDHVEDPFTPPVGKGAATVATTTAPSSTSSTTTTLATKTAVTSEVGGVPGLYGGTQDQKTCDKEKLVSYLEQNTEKGKAWADTLGIDQDDIRTYVDGLTPVLLRTDTRVTNHGYKNGKATSIQAVLQAGTAVLVDDYGRPVTKCACGNPLTDPVASTATYTGDRWEGFEPQTITVVVQNTVVITTFVLIDNDTGDPFGRPPGTEGEEDIPGEDLGPDDFDPDFCTGPTADPDLCVDLDATTTLPKTTTTVEPDTPSASNEALSGSYRYDIAATSGECAGSTSSGELTITVTGSSPSRTISWADDTGSILRGTLADDLTFSAKTSGAGGGDFDVLGAYTNTLDGKFDLHEDGEATFAATDTIAIEDGGTCTFDMTGVRA